MFACEYCRKEFTREDSLSRHLGYCKKRGGAASQPLKCPRCKKTFSRGDVLTRHLFKCEARASVKRSSCDNVSTPPSKKARCKVCEVDVLSWHSHLRTARHKNKVCEDGDEYTNIIRSAYKSRITSYRVFAQKEFLTPQEFLNNVKERVINLINGAILKVGSAVKANLELFGQYVKWMKTVDDQHEIEEMKSFNTRNKVLRVDSEIELAYVSFAEEIKVKADEFQERDSGWALKKILHLEININKYAPLKGSSYLSLPTWIQKKHACINIKNSDDECFAWAVTSALYPAARHSERTSSYLHYKSVLNAKDMEFPITFTDVRRFEELNNISVNVFEICGGAIAGPIYHTQQKRDKHVNLLLVEDGERAHYCWIKNLSRLVSSQITQHNHKMFICDSCLLTFVSEIKLSEHCDRGCAKIKISLPSPEDNILKFRNYKNRMRAPLVVYADFEALLLPISGCEPNNLSSYTMDYQLHVPYSYGYFIKCAYDDSQSKYVTYRGEDCVKEFLKSLEIELAPFAEKISLTVPMTPLTPEQVQTFYVAMNCYICGELLGGDRVRDHDHLTGELRGAAHKRCNLNFKIKPLIPIVFHNMSKYDSHFIIRKLQDRDVNILPKNKENFISVTSRKHGGSDFDLRFIDSYRFLPSGLDKLATNLSLYQFREIKAHCTEHLELLMRKGVFPYDYVSHGSKLQETSLPSRGDFFNKLTNSQISIDDYQHAQQVWNAFNIKTLGEYSDLYLKTDVMLLADIFENFRDVCLKTYQLDPAHYYTAPGLSWDAMLCSTRVELELLTDYEMVKLISNGIRGGLSQCCGKYAKANNKFMEDYDHSKTSNYIIYLDANNQYGWAMIQPMPLKDFRWLSEDEIMNFNVMEIPPDFTAGYIFEVDLVYPAHLHEFHNDLCFCPENRVPEVTGAITPKLLSTLHNKRNYTIHYMSLKQAINAGLELNKIHRVLTFTQSPWLKKYIDLNTSKRMLATNSFEKDFYKLMNNAVFGKTMENVEKRADVRLVNRWESEGKRLGARALISRLNFHSLTVIDEDLSVIQMKRNSVNYNKPIYIGFSVLELSKTLMFDFHYNYMKPKYGANLSLLYTDTDSFVYEVKTDNFYSDIRPDLEARFDTSDFSEANVFGLPRVNKKVVGMFKDECSGVMIKEFIGIRSKCYYIDKENEVTTFVPFSVQHFETPVPVCVTADLCNHTWKQVCASDSKSLTNRIFFDECDMYEHNCQTGKRFVKRHLYDCHDVTHQCPGSTCLNPCLSTTTINAFGRLPTKFKNPYKGGRRFGANPRRRRRKRTKKPVIRRIMPPATIPTTTETTEEPSTKIKYVTEVKREQYVKDGEVYNRIFLATAHDKLGKPVTKMVKVHNHNDENLNTYKYKDDDVDDNEEPSTKIKYVTEVQRDRYVKDGQVFFRMFLATAKDKFGKPVTKKVLVHKHKHKNRNLNKIKDDDDDDFLE